MANQGSKQSKLKPPDIEYLLALEAEMHTMYATQDEQIRTIRSMSEGTFAVPLDPQHRLCDIEIRDTTIADERLRVTATLTVNPLHLQVTPARPSDASQVNATLRERFTEECLRVSGTRSPGVNTADAAVDACHGDGGAWTKFVFTRDTWDSRYSIRLKDIEAEVRKAASEDAQETPPDIAMLAAEKYDALTEEAKKAAGPPFTWVCCDDLSIYPIRRAGALAEVLEIQEMPLSSAFRQYRLGTDAEGNIVPEELAQGVSSKAPSSVRRLELWTDKECVVAIVGNTGTAGVSGQVVQRWNHRYRRPPYFPAPGLMLNYWRNRKVGWSISQTKVNYVQYLSFLLTMHAQTVYRDALPTIIRETSEVAQQVVGLDGMPTGKTRNSEHWNPREIITLDPGEKLIPLQFPPVAASLREEIQIISEAIQRLDSPRIQNNIGAGVEGAGFAINSLLTEAKTRYNPIVISLEAMVREVVKFMWYLIRTVVKEKVWVYSQSDEGGWLCAGPDDLTDTVAIEVKLDPEQPSARLIEQRYWTEKWQSQMCSLDQAIEAQGGSPDEVRVGRAYDRLRESDWYLKRQEQFVLEHGGMGDITKQAQDVAATGIIPGMSNPVGMAGVGQDPAALAIANQGVGAQPVAPGPGATPGLVPGGGLGGAPVGMGPTVPAQAAAAGIQSLNMGR